MSDYGEALEQQAHGHVPLFRDRVRDEESLPLAPARPDGAYFHMQDRVWRVQFGGTDRFETFHIEDYDSANRLFLTLQAGGEP